MHLTSLLRRALYFGSLLLGASALLPSRTAAPGAVFAILAVYAHGAAGILGAKGVDKGFLFLESLPFFALAVAGPGRQEPLTALLLVGSAGVAGAALLAGEWLLGEATFTTSSGFVGVCCLAGWGLAVLPPVAFLGLALVALTLTGYWVACRVRG